MIKPNRALHTMAPPLAAAMIPAGASLAGQAEFSVQDLGVLGGPWNRAYAINDAGQIAGTALDSDFVQQPVR